MNMVTGMKWSNGLLLISALVQALTGVFFLFDKDPFVGVKFSQVHAVNAPVLVLLLGLHVMLNWSWFKTHYFRRKLVNRVAARQAK